MGQIMEFYQEFAAFQSLSNKDVVKYATKSLFYKFPSNTVVVREGDFPEEIFFLKSGRVKIVKRLNFKINPVTKALQYDDPSEPSQEDIERGHYKSMLIEIDELSPGDSFCDASILNKEAMHHTIICSMPCELIALPHYDLKTMSASLLEEYQTLCKTYPDNTDLRKAYLDRTKWDSWKKNLYQNIQIDKTNRRRGFDQQLRGPFIKRIQLEKLTIPLETDIKTNLLNMINQTVQTARVGTHSKLIESPNPTYNNLSRIKTGQDGSISKRKATVPLLPKINNINTTSKDLSSFRNGSYSHRDYSTMSANKLKFDFVVPKHRLANYEEKEVTTKGNEGEVINYNEGKVINTELTDEKARALVNFNFEELPPLTASDEDLDEDEKKSGADEDSSSVLGTRNIESTFTKVMSTMNLEMPTLKKKYKIKGSTLL